MAERDCLYVQGASGLPAYDAVDDRTLVAAVLGGDAFTSLVPGIGAVGRGHGVLASDALAVAQSGAGAAGVLVAPGLASVRGTSGTQYGAYLCPLDATENLQIDAKSATTGQNRKDLVVARVSDNQYGVAGDTWAPAVIKGVTSGSATDPNVTAATLVLARVNVFGGAGSTVIVTTNIDDLRPQARCVGGITPVTSTTAFPNPQDFDFVWSQTDSTLRVRKGTDWLVVGVNYDAPWTTFTPDWKSSVTIGDGNHYGRFIRLGRTVIGVAGFARGAGTTQAGKIKLAVPVPCNDPGITAFKYPCGARMHDNSAAVGYAAAGDVDPVNQEIVDFNTIGALPWSNTQPVTWATNDRLHVFYTYEAD